MSIRKNLTDEEATFLGLEINKKFNGRTKAKYRIKNEQWQKVLKLRGVKEVVETKTVANDYRPAAFVLSAWNGLTGKMMDINEYCIHYSLPRNDISSYKLVSHTGTPFYNIVFKEQIDQEVIDIDFDSIIKKHINRIDVKHDVIDTDFDFDVLTYTDVHIGMDTDKDNNSMYAEKWNRKTILKSARKMVKKTIENKKSNVLIVDDLGDLLDGLNARTTRGGHELPQNMTNEEAFDCALEFKNIIVDGLVSHYETIHFNNIVNDNHSGCFSYFLNKAFKGITDIKYDNVIVTNHRTFISHYIVSDIVFLISHGKDDKTLKFGFKPQLDTKQIEKIDQYIKHNNLYSAGKRIIFKKGDSHQAIFDMAGSDDFDYFNYPALSPSSQWVQNNFKKGRRGFFIDNFKGVVSTTTPIFL